MPFLKIALTFASFQSFEMQPIFNDFLNITVNGWQTWIFISESCLGQLQFPCWLVTLIAETSQRIRSSQCLYMLLCYQGLDHLVWPFGCCVFLCEDICKVMFYSFCYLMQIVKKFSLFTTWWINTAFNRALMPSVCLVCLALLYDFRFNMSHMFYLNYSWQ